MARLTAAFFAVVLTLSAADDLDSQIKSLISVYASLESNAADPVASEQAFYQGAIPGLLRVLDPHSVFFDPGQFDQLKRMEASTQKGFGSVVSILPGRVIVLQTLAGTPSAKAGLSPGDEILAVNGYVIAQLDLDQLAELLSESRQRPARLEVRKPGSAHVLDLTLIPAEMESPSVERAFLLGPGVGVGYIRVSSFDERTVQELKEAIEKLGGDRLAGLVLDFRNNPGGLVTAALETAALFLRPGQTIFTVRGRHVPEKAETVPASAKPYGFKLAILINGKTASASEIVTGALQDHDRATVLGEPSFGKGLVQTVYPLSEGTGLALTTALYYTPSGRSIQRPLDAAQFELAATTSRPNQAKEFRTDGGRVVTGGGGIRPDIAVEPPAMSPLRAVLEASGSFTTFATEYLRDHKVNTDFAVTPALMDQFQVFLAAHNIQPGVTEWSQERDFVANRLKTEIFNQSFGVEKGDEVEAERDPAIQRARAVVGS
ncbi:MAG: S41 family peptidase [Bryobacteraceae bacterium]|jgi:carboxyl-terminal processing protease